MVGERADPETIARLRAELHLDDPLPLQFVRYVGGVVRGDLGTSYITRRPILGDLLQRFPATLRLAGAAMLFAARHRHLRSASTAPGGPGAGPTGSPPSAPTSASRFRSTGWA